MIHDRRISSAILLGLLCSLQAVLAGKLAEIVQTARLRNGVILLVNAEPATYDEAAATGCTVRGLESDSAAVNVELFHWQDMPVLGQPFDIS